MNLSATRGTLDFSRFASVSVMLIFGFCARRFAVISLLVGCVACTIERPIEPESSSMPASSPAPKSAVRKPIPDDRYQTALDRADSARSISTSAQSPEDWELVVSRWKSAIELLKQVPKSDPNKNLANRKIIEFQKKLAIAKNRLDRFQNRITAQDPGIRVDKPLTSSELTEKNDSVYRVPIKYRNNRIPVIDVVFNGNQRFEMMLDTGASATMITEPMAKRLGVKIVGTSNAMTAAGAATVQVGMVRSISVAGSTIRDVPVAIGPLEIGLLGHDFFGACDISIKRDTVELERCNG